jgi:hypothetical protein
MNWPNGVDARVLSKLMIGLPFTPSIRVRPAPPFLPKIEIQNQKAAQTSMLELTIIEPGRQERHYWRDLWRVLAWRDLSVRYKQTAIGAISAWIRPLLTMLVFTIIFGESPGCHPMVPRPTL